MIINVDGQKYDIEQLSAEAKSQLQSFQFVELELQRLNAQAAVYQTARTAYATALKAALPTVAPVGDTIKLS